MWGYQDYEFEVPELQGERLQSLVLFGTPDDAQKLLGRLVSGGAFHAYLSAFIGFCHETDAEGAEFDVKLYEDVESMDIAQALGLHDQPIEGVRCRREGGHVTLEIVFSSATVRLVEVDPQDPHSDSRLELIRTEA
ncbi:MAG: hypothetical protein H6720_31055 [Sandaracinus sp.]|nr:hypothetical protein [Sandaracinus sp.]